tara:strand:+ start:231 stop:515 length:285 start_codon:yes stop_codon:yes gene_type:complete
MGFAGCRSSGVLTSSAVVSSDRALLISIHATEVAGSAATVKIWDNASAASGKEVARITLSANQTIEFDMHGVLCTNGIYFEEDAGSVAVSVEFA